MVQIFLDTANLDAIRKYNDMGILDGVTTNPTLLAKENSDPIEIMKEIIRIVKGPVSLEVVSTDIDGMLEEAHRLARFGTNAVIKIPMTPDGLKAIKRLSSEGIKTNCTLVFSPNQAILAAKAGATYVSPFIGRLDDAGHDGMQVIRDTVQIFRNYNFSTKVLVASVRHPVHVVEAAKIGADVITMPPDVLEKMIKHPLTDKGLSTFLADWEKVKRMNPNIDLSLVQP
ncbi:MULTISPECIES: fructose-6-phosphate aldolase [Candidatus Nitrosocaldus]|jgi:transaldolase|uniref:Probable transaldolase n=1 Tax=Candidatus Nitrosocaldus cavascurensis TaxID=2058097 RepID=A0A2K5APD9_9ARCH|nr:MULTISPECIES: fructose-6-phosphate aldolase [Candidatus Nitrosocaldus]SPC33506.1 transaldolase [Candidatus Nitrosocaldus cavascurensis]